MQFVIVVQNLKLKYKSNEKLKMAKHNKITKTQLITKILMLTENAKIKL